MIDGIFHLFTPTSSGKRKHGLMKCPHCRVAFHHDEKVVYIGQDIETHWGIAHHTCASCHRFILYLRAGGIATYQTRFSSFLPTATNRLIRPKASGRSPTPEEVKSESSEITEDYEEACLVLSDSPKASAALSRRCLQNLLRNKAGAKSKDLADAIEEVLNSKTLPSHLSEGLDAVRAIGNFGAHPIKSKSTGEIVPVEPGEAEWNLDVIEGLFDFYYVQPAVTAKRRADLEKKLADAGKPPLRR